MSDYEHGYGCVGLTVNWGSGGTYNAAGQMAGLQRLQSVGPCSGTGSGTPEFFNEAWIYNTANLLTEIDTSAQSGGYPIGVPSPGPATHASFFAEYNYTAGSNNGQVASVTDARTNATSTYGYDLLKRLSSASTGTWAQSYSYDGFGNLATKTVPPGSAEPAFPGVNSAKNWLSGATYDANGNTVALNTAGYGYDVENRMISFTSGNFVENYAYDENNHRIERSSASADTVYFYGAGGNLLGSYMITFPGGVNYAASVIAQQVYFGGMLIGQTKGTDFSGDASTLTDRLGTAVPGYPYGTDIGNPPAGDQVDFATYTKEPNSGLEYANQRYYSAGMGRFMTTDIGSPIGSNPSSWNRYTYVLNDPVGKTDPTGQYAVDCSLDPDFCDSLVGWSGGGFGGSSGSAPCSAVTDASTPCTPSNCTDPSLGCSSTILVVAPPILNPFGGNGQSGGGGAGQQAPQCEAKFGDVPWSIPQLPGRHSFFYLQDNTFNVPKLGGQEGWDVIDGGPQYLPPKVTVISYWPPIVDVDFGKLVTNVSTNGLYNEEANQPNYFWDRQLSCAEVSAIETLAKSLNGIVPYTAGAAYNSNSLTYTIDQKFDLGIVVPKLVYLPGWGSVIP